MDLTCLSSVHVIVRLTPSSVRSVRSRRVPVAPACNGSSLTTCSSGRCVAGMPFLEAIPRKISQTVNTVELEAPNVNPRDRGLPLLVSHPGSACWPGVERVAPPSLAAFVAVLVRDPVCR